MATRCVSQRTGQPLRQPPPPPEPPQRPEDDDATTGSERIYRANFAAVTAYFARHSADPQIVADLTADTFNQQDHRSEQR